MYHVFYRGGVFALQNAFEWGLTVGREQSIPEREIDLERGLKHWPLIEGDRVALREVPWLRYSDGVGALSRLVNRCFE